MDEYIRTVLTLLELLFITLFIPSLSAQDINIPYLNCEITLTKNTIISGEPISVCFTITNTSGGEVHFALDDGYDIWDSNLDNRLKTELLKISFQDSRGEELPRRKLLCRPHSQVLFFTGDLNPGEKMVGEYPLHLRVSTLISPGEYRLTVKAFDLVHGYMSPEYLESVGPKDKKIGTSVRESFSGPTLTLNVEPYDDAKLIAVYEDIMTKARYAIDHPSGSWCGFDYNDISTPTRTLLWAEGPAAVPYQIELIYDKEKGFRYWPPAIVNTWDNIVRYATPSQVEQILEMARHPECYRTPGQEYSKYYTPGLAWAIHQWHENGSEEVKESTEELAEKLPEEDPCPRSMELGQYPYGKP